MAQARPDPETTPQARARRGRRSKQARRGRGRSASTRRSSSPRTSDFPPPESHLRPRLRLRAADGRAALPRGAQRRPARGARARRARPDHGRGHRRLQRRLQGHPGPAGGVRREARARHADLREHDRRRRRRRRDDRAAAGRRADDGQLLAAGDGPDRQPHGDDPLHVRRPGDGADGGADAAGRRPPARPDALALPGGDLPARAGDAARRAVHAGRRQGPAEGRDPRRQPGRLHRARVALRAQGRGARRRGPPRRLRPGRDPARGRRT